MIARGNHRQRLSLNRIQKTARPSKYKGSSGFVMFNRTKNVLII